MLLRFLFTIMFWLTLLTKKHKKVWNCENSMVNDHLMIIEIKLDQRANVCKIESI